MLLRVAMSLESSSLEKHLKTNLTSAEFHVTLLKNKSPLQVISKEPVDAIILSEDKIPKPIISTLNMLDNSIDSPVIIILSTQENEKHNAQLLAAGADAVLYAGLTHHVLYEAIVKILLKRNESQTEIIKDQKELSDPKLIDFVSNSPSMAAFINIAQRVAKSDSSILILGETGVGKERLALALHAEGTRCDAPFIPINCAALPDNLIESELFGHEQGAFTGAARARRGAFELAHHGTIFLDEIGDMPLSLQSKLLRVLQDKKFQKIGGENTIEVDVRVMAATNKDLLKEVEAGNFRQDLYYRVSVVTLDIPPLRSRREDIRELCYSYINYLSPKIGIEVNNIDEDALAALVSYEWPGNIRELINVLERAILISESDIITLQDLPDDIASPEKFSSSQSCVIDLEQLSSRPWKEVRGEVVSHYERMYLEQILKKAEGNISKSAKLAGMTTRALHTKMTAHMLDKWNYK